MDYEKNYKKCSKFHAVYRRSLPKSLVAFKKYHQWMI
jgi:hypothetical protein